MKSQSGWSRHLISGEIFILGVNTKPGKRVFIKASASKHMATNVAAVITAATIARWCRISIASVMEFHTASTILSVPGEDLFFTPLSKGSLTNYVMQLG